MKEIPDYAEIMTREGWLQARRMGAFIPYDGIGYWATATHMDTMTSCFDEPPAWATHVAWFNK